MRPSRIRVFDGLRVTTEHLEHLQDAIFSAIEDLREQAGLERPIHGLEVEVTGTRSLRVAPGLAFDGQRRRLALDQPADVDLDDVSPGDELVLYLEYSAVEEGVVDGVATLLFDAVSVAVAPEAGPDALILATIVVGGIGADLEVVEHFPNEQEIGEWSTPEPQGEVAPEEGQMVEEAVTPTIDVREESVEPSAEVAEALDEIPPASSEPLEVDAPVEEAEEPKPPRARAPIARAPRRPQRARPISLALHAGEEPLPVERLVEAWGPNADREVTAAIELAATRLDWDATEGTHTVSLVADLGMVMTLSPEIARARPLPVLSQPVSMGARGLRAPVLASAARRTAALRPAVSEAAPITAKLSRVHLRASADARGQLMVGEGGVSVGRSAIVRSGPEVEPRFQDGALLVIPFRDLRPTSDGRPARALTPLRRALSFTADVETRRDGVYLVASLVGVGPWDPETIQRLREESTHFRWSLRGALHPQQGLPGATPHP